MWRARFKRWISSRAGAQKWEPIAKLRKLLAENGREGEPFEFVIGGEVQSLDDVKRWEDAGITRLVLAPWRRSKEAIEGLRRFADLVF